jgi:diguanylate cyclase (GGDEF)-like protein/PAS domain S-box-containing protein
MTTPNSPSPLRLPLEFNTEEYLNVVDHGVLFVDAQGILRYYNPFCQKLFALEYPSHQPINYFHLLSSWSDTQGLSRLWLIEFDAAMTAQQRHYTRVKHNDDTLEFKYQPLPSGGFVHCIYNITRKAKQEQISALHYSQLQTMIDAMPCFVSLLNTNLQFVIANQYYEQHLGISRSDIEGSYVSDILPPSLKERHMNLLHKALHGETQHFDDQGPSEESPIKFVHGAYIPCFDQHHNVTGIVDITYDTTDQRNQEENLRFLAERDPLTGLFNRRKVMECLDLEILRANRQSSPLSVAVLDLDYFKNVNDTWGHAAGDLVLKEFALLCQQQIRKLDYLGRIGGEEFFLIMGNTDQQEASIVLERILSVLRHHTFKWQQIEIHITCSAGFVQWEPTQSNQQLYSLADNALYQAKNQGRDQIVIAT